MTIEQVTAVLDSLGFSTQRVPEIGGRKYDPRSAPRAGHDSADHHGRSRRDRLSFENSPSAEAQDGYMLIVNLQNDVPERTRGHRAGCPSDRVVVYPTATLGRSNSERWCQARQELLLLRAKTADPNKNMMSFRQRFLRPNYSNQSNRRIAGSTPRRVSHSILAPNR